MKKKVIQTEKAPKAIGPYSQAIQAGDFLFLSGQIPLDPKTGELARGDIREQTKQVLENIKGILESQKLGMENLVKTTIFLKEIGNLLSLSEKTISTYRNRVLQKMNMESNAEIVKYALQKKLIE